MGFGILIDILSIFILLLAGSIALRKGELPDLKCSDGPYTKDKSTCREGNGKSYAGSHPKETDSAETLLNKIQIAAGASRKDILWRRCFLPAIAATLCLFGLVLRRMPRWFELFSATFFIMMPIYFMQTFYSHHHYAHIEKNIQNSVTFLKDRLSGALRSPGPPEKKEQVSADGTSSPNNRLPKPNTTKSETKSENEKFQKKHKQDQKSNAQAKPRRRMKKPTYD
jgi:hypothetical protein